MSWTLIKPYFRSRLAAQNLTEWPDPFDLENLPMTIADRSYGFDIGQITGISNNQNNQETIVPITVKIILKGFRNISEAEDAGIAIAENLMKDSVKASNIKAVEGLHNVIFVGMNPQPFSTENESLILIEMDFETRIIFCV
jgi:hypothetical protein